MQGIRVENGNVSVLLVNASLSKNRTSILCRAGPNPGNMTESRTAVLTVFGEWTESYWSHVNYSLYLFYCLKQITQILRQTSVFCQHHWSHLLSHGSLHSLYLEWHSATLSMSPTWTPVESSGLVNWSYQASTSVAQKMVLPVMPTSSQSLPGMQQDWVNPVIPSLLVCHHVKIIGFLRT